MVVCVCLCVCAGEGVGGEEEWEDEGEEEEMIGGDCDTMEAETTQQVRGTTNHSTVTPIVSFYDFLSRAP